MMFSRKLSYSYQRFLESRIVFLGAVVLFRFALEISYLYFVHPLYAYSGFIIEFSVPKYAESWAVLIVLLFFAPRRLKRPSDLFVLLLLLGLIVPLLSLYALADHSRKTVYIVLLGYLLIDIFRRGRIFLLPKIKYGVYVSLTVALLGALAVSAWFIFSGGLENFNLDMKKVYEFRRATEELIAVGYMGYLNTWSTKVFGPFLLAYGLLKKNYVLIFLALLFHFFWFGVSAHKAVVFYPLMVMFLWLYFRRTQILSLLPMSYFFVVLISLSWFFLFENSFLGSLFIRRLFFVIANNTFDYYTFFGEGQFVYWSNSITSGFINYPYHLGPAELIGQWRGTESHVNNTFLATGYMHAGVFGIVSYGIIAGFIFRLLDSLVSKEFPLWFVTAIMIIPLWSLLLSADLPTAMVTHGIIAAAILAFLARSRPTRIQISQESSQQC